MALWLELPRPGAGVCPGAMVPISIGAAPDVLFLMKARTLSSKLWSSTFVYINPCFHRSAVGLWDHSHTRRFDDGAGHRFFWSLSSEFSDQLPDHVQQVKKIPQSGWVASILGVDWQLRLRLARSSRGTGRSLYQASPAVLEVSTISRVIPAASLTIAR